MFSDAARHRAHREVADAGVRVSGARPEAVHGRVQQRAQPHQCAHLPVPIAEGVGLLPPPTHPPPRPQAAEPAH